MESGTDVETNPEPGKRKAHELCIGPRNLNVNAAFFPTHPRIYGDKFFLDGSDASPPSIHHSLDDEGRLHQPPAAARKKPFRRIWFYIRTRAGLLSEHDVNKLSAETAAVRPLSVK